MKGGYYRHDFGIEKISLISLNSMHFAEENRCLREKGEEQLRWLREQLSVAQVQDPYRRFLLAMHIFPGVIYAGHFEDTWHANFTKTFLEILEEFDSVELITGGHIHRSEVRMSKSKLYPKVGIPLVVTPTLTPIYFNNPSFTVKDMTKDKRNEDNSALVFEKFFVRAFQLQYNILFNSNSWINVDPKNAYGLDLNHPKTINPLVIVPTSFHFGYFIGYEHAYNTITGTLMSLAAPLIDMFFIPSVKENIACSLLFWNKSE